MSKNTIETIEVCSNGNVSKTTEVNGTYTGTSHGGFYATDFVESPIIETGTIKQLSQKEQWGEIVDFFIPNYKFSVYYI